LIQRGEKKKDLFLIGGNLLGGLLDLLLNTGGAGVDPLGTVGGDGDNDTLGSQLADSEAGKGAADAETIDQDGGRNQLVGGDLLHELVVGGLVEDDGVVGLILNLSLGPFLLIVKIYHDRVRR